MNTFTVAQVVEIRRNNESDWEEGIVTRVWDNGRYVTVGVGPESKSLFVRLVEQVRPSQKLAAWRAASEAAQAAVERRTVEIEVGPATYEFHHDQMTFLGYADDDGEWIRVLVTSKFFANYQDGVV
jgi:hypothetical protein